MVSPEGAVLVVDPEPTSADGLAKVLAQGGLEPACATTAEDALLKLGHRPFDVLVTELELPDMAGIDLVHEVRRRWPEVDVIVLTRDASVPRAVEAMKAGAADFLLKPAEQPDILSVIHRALGRARSAAEERPDGDIEAAGPAIIGRSAALRKALDVARRAAQSNATVLVRGETGTGKELVAHLLHALGPRSSGPFVKVQCSSLPETLLESELFGYERGAFTGATTRKPGRVEVAQGGTLFLDEIGDIALPMQAKLLRLLQDRQYERLGGNKTLAADVRFVTATFRDLEAMVRSGLFRQDLFYRLNVVTVWLPPLRSRREDIPELVAHFSERFATLEGGRRLGFDAGAMQLLQAERWPGNVRQLENLVQRLTVLGEGATISMAEVQREIAAHGAGDEPASGSRFPAEAWPSSTLRTLDEKVRETERRALLRALERTRGNRSLAARLLGISRATLYKKLAEHGLG